jgi:hypothetical protein
MYNILCRTTKVRVLNLHVLESQWSELIEELFTYIVDGGFKTESRVTL